MRKSLLFKILIVVGMLAMTSTPTFAEVPERDSEVARRQTEELEKAVLAAREARKEERRQKLKDITYQDLLKDPDNIEMNLRYAEEQVQKNNLLAAVAALERILIMDPERYDVRLFYGVLFFRLDNLNEAERELKRLDELELPPDIRSEVDAYLNAIKQRRKRTRVGLRQSVGFGFDTNRNASARSKQNLLFDATFDLAGANIRRRDTHFLAITGVDVRHDLGTQAGHELLGSFTYFRQDQTTVDSLDIGSLQYRLGGVYKTRFFHFTPTFEASHVFLSHQSFLRTQAGNFEISKQFKKWDVRGDFRIERQDFLPIDENAVAPQRKGRELDFGFLLGYLLRKNMKVTYGMNYTNNNAEEDFNAYERMQMTLGHTWILPKGQFVLQSVEAGFDYYDEPDTAVASRFRRDKTLRYRVTYGMPLGAFLAKILPKILESVTLTASYEFYRASSNITNFTYENHKFQGVLTKSWEL